MIKTLKNQKGMTLVELLAVMVIVGIIAAISIPAIGNLMENSRKDAHISNAVALQEAARLYATSNEAELTQFFTTSPDAGVTITFDSNSWTVGATAGTAPSASFTGYLDSLTDPHSKAQYPSAQAIIYKNASTGSYSITVALKGSKLGIAQTSTPSTLSRTSVITSSSVSLTTPAS